MNAPHSYEPHQHRDHQHEHHHHHEHSHQAHPAATASSLNSIAAQATVHCLTGCATGEIAGMALGTWFGWSNAPTIVLATVLAFATGYVSTMRPLLKSGLGLREVMRLALVADTASIAVMELVDNLTMVILPGAMNASLTSLAFWVSMAVSLVLGGFAAFPVNRWLIQRGRGHAVVHAHH